MIFKKMLGIASEPGDVFGAEDITSAAMKNAVAEWYDLYFRCAPSGAAAWAQRIPYTIVDALQCACFGEYRAGVAAGGNAAKARLLGGALDALERVRGLAFQHALIGGEVFIKPVPRAASRPSLASARSAETGEPTPGDLRSGGTPRGKEPPVWDRSDGSFSFTVVARPGYMVLGRDDAGAITAVGSREVSWQDGRQFTLLEKRLVGPDGLLTIESRLYESRSKGSLGRRVPLDKVAKYAGMREVLTLPRPCGLGMVHMKTPMVNCVDQSFDGVSIYAAAAGKIAAAARHEARTEDEYRLTQPRVIASVDIMRRDENGDVLDVPEYIVPIVDDEPASAGLTVYNPAPNQAQLEARMHQHLRDIENIVGLRRGMLSGVEAAERTATEVAATSARYAMTVAGLCAMWRRAVADVAALCDVMGRMYLGWDAAPAPGVEISFGDGVLYDADKEFDRLFRCVEAGVLPREALVDWMGAH